MGIHESPVAWIGYVISGVGEMTIGDKDANLTGAITFTPGDYLMFEPNTMHGWKNTGDEEILLLFLTATAE